MRIGKAKTSTKITFVAVLRLKPPIGDAPVSAQVFALVDVGKTRAEAAEELEISIRSVFRILRTRKDAENAPVAPPVTRIRVFDDARCPVKSQLAHSTP